MNPARVERHTHFAVGVDFGTDSVRVLIVDAADGNEIAGAVAGYPRWSEGKYCDPLRSRFRQHPLDYLEAFEEAIGRALKEAPPRTAERIAGLTADATGSTPGPFDGRGAPLALTPIHSENPNAMFVLWKDHTAIGEAEEINRLSRSWGGPDFTRFEGGIYSAEWFWAKIVHVLREDPAVRGVTGPRGAGSWAEHCDWMPALLTGNSTVPTWKRSRCAAGHKAMWHESFGGLPPEEFLVRLDPMLQGLRSRLYEQTFTSDEPAGKLSPEWAHRLGLGENVTVGVGAIDAHMGAIGGEIRPYVLAKIMGTSTCDMIVVKPDELGDAPVRGICGQVDGSIVPRMIGLEAGQSAFGDVYAWFRDLLLWPLHHARQTGRIASAETVGAILSEVEAGVMGDLSREAERLPIEEDGLLAIDWLNGRRTPDANQLLKGAIAGLTLGSSAPALFRALVEATAFGTKKIVERFRAEGVRIDEIMALGGVAKKAPFVMQVVADVLDMRIKVPKSDETCALGAAMCAATAAGIYPRIEDAMAAMGHGIEKEYVPSPSKVEAYKKVYQRYSRLAEFLEDEVNSSSGRKG